MSLAVFLHGEQVGVLRAAEAGGVVSFTLNDAYAEALERPVLGQFFEDRRDVRSFRQASQPGALPAFFANLLPEGALRALITAQTSVRDDMALLARLGDDLPGAITVQLADETMGGRGAPRFASDRESPPAATLDEGPSADATSPGWRFSLAGMQLKFSGDREPNARFTLPFRGRGGRWILKFGSAHHAGLPENEFFTTRWAAACGLAVPEHELVPARSLAGLDPRFLDLGEHAFAIARYDRGPGGLRIHQEDLAQVRGIPPVPPILKYQGPSYQRLALFVAETCGLADCEEFLKRVLFMILSGNVDGHLKNWSLYYPDGRAARLAPVYDFVAILGHYQSDLYLAAELVKGVKEPASVRWEHIERMDSYLRDKGHALSFVRTAGLFVERCLDVWASQRPLVDATYRQNVDKHLGTLALARRP